jgi:vancomycin resistance protein YoaR
VLADATAVDVLRALQRLEPATIVVRTRVLTPTLTDAGMAPAVAEARALLKSPLLLRHGEQTWAWEPERIAAFLSIKVAGSTMTTSIDPERLARTVEQLAQTADSPSAEPRVAFRDGKPRITADGQVGWRIKQPETVKAISAALRSPRRELELPGEELTPQITAKTLPTLGIVELVGEGRTSYAGSA